MRVLITGACGSVGRALVHELLAQGKTVCAFDHNEDGLFALRRAAVAAGCAERLKPFLGCVRDADRLDQAVMGVDLILHCAALQHVELGEYNPFEVLSTNVAGTDNIVRSALRHNIPRAILTSSDKAVNPSSTMGASKLLAERLFISGNNFSGANRTRFSCVRFGNVWATNGSVATIFRSQLKSGKPITLTSRRMTRFFIRLTDAVALCLESAEQMVGGEIFVLDMGVANLGDIADEFAARGKVPVQEIGLLPGEKLYEELYTEQEAERAIVRDNMTIVLPETAQMPRHLSEAILRSAADGVTGQGPLRSDYPGHVRLDVSKLVTEAIEHEI